MSLRSTRVLRERWKLGLGAVAACALVAPASAQFGNEWLEYARNDGMLGPSSTAISNSSNEVDFDWADVNKDGWTDLVVVRKQPFTSSGKRSNVLLMNENGVLVDRTSLYASSSDVPGDQGFLTPTNDRDVVLTDVDGDGWLDIVTAPTLSDGDPKAIGHPRVYMNQGEDAAKVWQGFRHEDARIPQFFHATNGSPQNPRFCSVAAGDVTGNGMPDLYFGDYDSGPGSSSSNDLNDRLLINDGNGFFTDESSTRMTTAMLKSAFGTAVEIEDMNGDGVNDIVKDTALNNPTYVAASYNNPNNEGFFNIFDDFHGNAPYHIDVGDLNNDGRPDLLTSDDGTDKYRYNTGNDVFGRVEWSPTKTFQFLSGGDDGFGSNNLIIDLDQDGWNDAVVCDVDVDISGCNRRMHIYHNPGGAVGSQITLREEREQQGSGGWLGAKGLLSNDLRGAHDVAFFDIDNDTDLDMVLGRCAGTFVWENRSVPTVCAQNLGHHGPGDVRLRVCGTPLFGGGSAELTVTGGPPNSPTFLASSLSFTPTPFLGGTVVTFPLLELVSLTTDEEGTAVLPGGVPGGGGPLTLFVQAAVFDPGEPELFEISNALQVDFLP